MFETLLSLTSATYFAGPFVFVCLSQPSKNQAPSAVTVVDACRISRLIFLPFPRTKRLKMRRILLWIGFELLLAASLRADSNLRIADVGLHGYYGNPSAIRLIVRNPSSQAQPVHLRVSVSVQWGATNAVTADILLNGGEQREVELPVAMSGGKLEITAEASASGAVFGHDSYEGSLRQTNLIVLMCGTENLCKTAQSQIQFSGSIEERVDKNRQIAFEIVRDPRDHWWAYSAAKAIVLAAPMAQFTSAEREALEGFLRRGGRMVLLEREIADPSFLSAYRTGPAPANGERVGKGALFRVSDLDSNTLGNVFAGLNLQTLLVPRYEWNLNDTNWLKRRFASSFEFPRLGWLLIWLAAYTMIIGVVNFAVLRRLHRLEFGWISTCALALLFAAGFYFFSASRRPKQFDLDNLAVYYLDSRSSLAVAEYSVRVSAPERRDVQVSIADPAVFNSLSSAGAEVNGQIWAEMNQQGIQEGRETEIRLGPPREIELSLLKWSFRDLNLEGLREFSGTVHWAGPKRLRNDTGQRFGEAVYLDNPANALYVLPAMAPGEEIQLDGITPTPIRKKDGPPAVIDANFEYSAQTLQELALRGALPLAWEGRMFVGLSDGPALAVELNIPHQERVHSLVVVALEP